MGGKVLPGVIGQSACSVHMLKQDWYILCSFA